MNDNKISEAELLRRMGCTPYATMCQRMSNYLRGRNDPPKYIIDKMIAATGMKYEEIFYREDE
jgi:transcriptional regulator with XRE-family HTH domain